MKQARSVSTIDNKTVGVIADEPIRIDAAVVGIKDDGRALLAGNAGKQHYELEVHDGEYFSIRGVPFYVEIHPERGRVIVYQLYDSSTAAPSPPG